MNKNIPEKILKLLEEAAKKHDYGTLELAYLRGAIFGYKLAIKTEVKWKNKKKQ